MRARLTVAIGAGTLVLLAGGTGAAQTPTATAVIPPTVSFGAARIYPVGIEPVAVAAGFFDADDSLDLVTVNYGGDSATQLNNDGTGRFNRFGADRFLGTETYPTWIATLRKDTDARHEFIAVRDPTEAEDPNGDFFGRAETIRANTFARLNRQVVGESPTFVRTGVDFNGDDREDAVVVNNFGDSLSLLLNRGDTYNNQTIETVPGPIGVTFGDFNGDSLPDIAALSDSGDLAIHLNLGGTILANPRFASCADDGCLASTVGLQPSALESGDVNGDGHLDLAIADYGGDSVLVLLGRGDATFEEPTEIPLGNGPESIAVADFNVDGLADVAVTLPDTDQIQILLGRGDGTLSSATAPMDAGLAPSSLVAADLDNNGRIDLATASEFLDAVVVLLNGVSPPPFTPTITPTPSRSRTPTGTRTPTRTITPTATASRTRTATPETPPTPSPASTPTNTAEPTATALPATHTPLPPTSTRRPTPTSTPLPPPTATSTPSFAGLGDANCDGHRSASDLLAIVDAIAAGGEPACPGADVNGDGVVDEADLEPGIRALYGL
jgi:hypothetical protein